MKPKSNIEEDGAPEGEQFTVIERDGISVRVHVEVTTNSGQVVSMYCHPDDVEMMKAVLKNAHSFQVPVTHSVNVGHGTYGMYSRYNIVQHEYAGGGYPGNGGTIEVLEVKDPPDDRHGIVVYWNQEYGIDIESGFAEFKTVEQAVKAFNKVLRNSSKRDKTLKEKESEGFIRLVQCGFLTPWFYAVGNEELYGDYTLPQGMSDDPVFRLGTRLVVQENETGDGIVWLKKANDRPTKIKTCMGCRFVKEKPDLDHRRFIDDKLETKYYRIVYFDDGTVWNEKNGGDLPRPLREDELWIDEAINQFYKLLSGENKSFDIRFIDGSKFSAKVSGDRTKGHTIEGEYSAIVTFSDGTTKEGRHDFKPSNKFPSFISLVEGKLKRPEGVEIDKIEIVKRIPKKGGKSWTGVFFGRKSET